MVAMPKGYVPGNTITSTCVEIIQSASVWPEIHVLVLFVGICGIICDLAIMTLTSMYMYTYCTCLLLHYCGSVFGLFVSYITSLTQHTMMVNN